MRLRNVLSRILCLCLALGLASTLTYGHTPVQEMSDAATHWLSALNPEQKAKATFELTSEERLNWHFIPRPRKGLPLKEMTPAQKSLAEALLASGLSQRGFAKAKGIMSLEDVLRTLEAGKQGPVRDEELYYFSIFGTPGDTNAWGWRVEGHHLALNFTIVNGALIANSPSFFGSNPADVLEGPRKGFRVLGQEEDLGRSLIQSLNADQRKVAIIATNAPKDIFTEAKRKVTPLADEGILFSKLTHDQQTALRHLIEEYVHRYRPELAANDLAKIQKGGWSKLRFAWAGGLEKFQGHYYRIQGPSFLLEYDSIQNNNNHIHSVWRDFNGDFGEDLLKQHYEKFPH